MSDDLGLKRGTVRLEPYNPKWAEYFTQEKKLLEETFGDRILAIEHIGSTSIPNLIAKPIIDMIVGIESLEHIDDFVRVLQTLGYENMPNRWFEVDSQTAWKNQIFFRDYLRKNIDVRNEYEQLKISLAIENQYDRESYTESKKEFIMKINELALNAEYKKRSQF